jgi:transcriptional regulator with XRE-family HTH domain
MTKMQPKGLRDWDFGDAVRKCREYRLLTQSELARRTGLEPSAICHIETNRRAPSFWTLRALVFSLGVSADVILGTELLPLRRLPHD